MKSLLHALNELTQDSLESLIGIASEDKYLEFKRDLPKQSTDDKKEYLRDVSAFANTEGGVILYGIEEAGGTAAKVVGVEIPDYDKELLRLEKMLLDGIRPRIVPMVQFKHIPLDNGRSVIALRIMKSLNAPHMVTADGDNRFHARKSNGKFQMDVDDLRRSFASANTLVDGIRSFRVDRIGMIASDSGPVPLEAGALLTLHLIPMSRSENASVDLAALRNSSEVLLQPMHASSGNHRFTFDGYLEYAWSDQKGKSRSYALMFKDGSIEATAMIGDTERKVLSSWFENTILDRLPKHLQAQAFVGIEAPILACLTLINAEGYVLNNQIGFMSDHPIDRDILLVPPVRIDDTVEDLGSTLRPAFDAVWNAAGYPHSMNYDANGMRLSRASTF